jgi:poly-gamma-glutamate synthesis protein (capsule biosynthesis protein)
MRRRKFLTGSAGAIVLGAARVAAGEHRTGTLAAGAATEENERMATLFLCGDVMTGRGIDQILRTPGQAQLFEPYARSALDYVKLAERRNGPIPRRVDPAYVWGDALDELARVQPDARIVNLETAITTSEHPAAWKSIHYRMHPANIACLTAAGIDCCELANNHVLDWGPPGLEETLATLRRAGVRTAGAGRDGGEAAAPGVIDLAHERRCLVFAWATEDSGVPDAWAAGAGPGVNLLRDFSTATVARIARAVAARKRPGDIAVLSIHWGGNWGYRVGAAERAFAHALIDEAQIDVLHGHSSHHARGIEVHHDRLILYGCGDFLNDYEGIGGHEAYRPDLALMYFPTLGTTGALQRLRMVPTRTQRFRIHRATGDDAAWLRTMLDREGRELGTGAAVESDGALLLRWGERPASPSP